MTTLKCYGYSDDSAYIEYDDCSYSGDCFKRIAVAKLTAHDGEALVTFVYMGTWSVGIAQTDEDVPLPEWAKNARFGVHEDSGYSVELILDVPDDTKITWGTAAGACESIEWEAEE